MKYVTDETTFAELALLKAKHGVYMVRVTVGPQKERPYLAYVSTLEHSVFGSGTTEAEAMDDAFARLVHRIAELMPQQAGRGASLP